MRQEPVAAPACGFPSKYYFDGCPSAGATFVESAAKLAGLAGVLLGWRPAEFWAATPEELAVVIAAMAGGGPQAMARGELDRLKEMFPDG